MDPARPAGGSTDLHLSFNVNPEVDQSLELVKEVHSLGYRLSAWTVNMTGGARAPGLDLGVDAIFTRRTGSPIRPDT